MVQKKDKNLGGEPITVSAATSALLLEAVSDYYRQQHKSKKSIKGGATSGMMGSPIESSHLLLDAGEAAERPFTQAAVGATVGGSKNKNKKSKNNNLEGGAHGTALQLHPGDVPTTTILTDPATGALPGVGNQLGGKKNKKSKKDDKKNGGDGADMNASYMLPATGGKNKKNNKKDKNQQGGNHSDGYAHNFSSDRSDSYAGVNDKLTILMGGKNKKDTKKDKKNKNGGGDIGVATYGVSGNSVTPEPAVQMGGKKKRVSRKNKEKGGDGIEVPEPGSGLSPANAITPEMVQAAQLSDTPAPGSGLYPANAITPEMVKDAQLNDVLKNTPAPGSGLSPANAITPEMVANSMNTSVGGKKTRSNNKNNNKDNKDNNKNEDKQDGGKKKRESRKNKDKKLVGGLQELNALLGALSGGK